MGLKDMEMDLIDQCKELRFKDIDPEYIKETSLLNYYKANDNELITNKVSYSTLLDIIPQIVDNILPESKFSSIKNKQKRFDGTIKGWSLFNELKVQ